MSGNRSSRRTRISGVRAAVPVTEEGSRLMPGMVDAIGRSMGHKFVSIELVERALTHSSAKTDAHPSNERLEFFGDAVIGLVVTEMVFHGYPDYPEGEMTRVKSVLVSRETLAQKALIYGFQRFMIVGKGVGARERLPRSILANLFEALVAALYLDAGFEICRKFLQECFSGDIGTLIGRQITRNYKSALQQLAQARMGITPTYVVRSESGPDHDKRFIVAAMLAEKEQGLGEGNSKKEAEQVAARSALKAMLAELEMADEEDSMLLELPDDEFDEEFEEELALALEEGGAPPIGISRDDLQDLPDDAEDD